MLVIRIIVLIIALIAMVVYGTISIAKHLTNKRRPIKYAEGTASVDFFNDLESLDIDTKSRKSLWDWLLTAWIYEELFDADSDNTSHDDTHDYDSSYDYNDYEEDY